MASNGIVITYADKQKEKQAHEENNQEDATFFVESGEVYSKASDDLFEYVMIRTSDTLVVEYETVYNRFREILKTEVRELAWDGLIEPDDGYHETMKIVSREYKFKYIRRAINGD